MDTGLLIAFSALEFQDSLMSLSTSVLYYHQKERMVQLVVMLVPSHTAARQVQVSLPVPLQYLFLESNV